MAALATWTREDGLLGALAPLGLAASVPTCLVVDLDPDGPRYPGSATLAGLVGDGPRRDDLAPSRRGLAVLANGGVTADEARPVLEALVAGWPAVVVRLPASFDLRRRPCPVVPVRPLFPGALLPPGRGPAVYQHAGWNLPLPGPGVALPRPSPAVWAALAAGSRPPADRWIRAWRVVWRLPWR
jgi:hypothetical protein